MEAVLRRSRARREVTAACGAVRGIATAEALAVDYMRIQAELRVWGSPLLLAVRFLHMNSFVCAVQTLGRARAYCVGTRDVCANSFVCIVGTWSGERAWQRDVDGGKDALLPPSRRRQHCGGAARAPAGDCGAAESNNDGAAYRIGSSGTLRGDEYQRHEGAGRRLRGWGREEGAVRPTRRRSLPVFVCVRVCMCFLCARAQLVCVCARVCLRVRVNPPEGLFVSVKHVVSAHVCTWRSADAEMMLVKLVRVVLSGAAVGAEGGGGEGFEDRGGRTAAAAEALLLPPPPPPLPVEGGTPTASGDASQSRGSVAPQPKRARLDAAAEPTSAGGDSRDSGATVLPVAGSAPPETPMASWRSRGERHEPASSGAGRPSSI